METRFENLAINPLDGIRVSFSRRSQYAHIHLERLIANNPSGVYDQLIAATTSAYNAYKGELSGNDLQKAVAKGCTFELNDCGLLFRSTARRFEGLVRSTFGRGTEAYVSFFPRGLDEFNHATQDNIPTLIDRTLSLGNTYKDQLDSPAYTMQFANLKTRYATAFKAQKQTLGSVKNLGSVRDILWAALKKQLYKNMLFIAFTNIDEPEMMLTYFEPRLLRLHKKTSTSTKPVRVQLAPSTTVAANLKFTASSTILLVNEGKLPIFFYGGETALQPAPAVLTTLQAGGEIELKASAIGAPSNKFLLLMNQDEAAKAEVRYSLL